MPRGGHLRQEREVDFEQIGSLKIRDMKALILFIAWCVLFVLCWPLALLALVLFPLVWLISIPLRLVGISIEAVMALVKALLFLPARLLGHRPRSQ